MGALDAVICRPISRAVTKSAEKRSDHLADEKSGLSTVYLTPSSNNGLQAYILDLTGNNGSLGKGKYLLINNNNQQMDSGDLFIELTGSTSSVASDFILVA
ncbi:hypothetical protein [Neopusillimonas aromaticivorans]|uniref:hypothetical protein n=1 Tax=Neopusillimonas aromaticivorans TaxID=2979868 RepID=UPI00259A0785|nr:hypothetical protein [Neopusillimonas aromaticivorans]WJJ93126.1 hypothetical protein N7E01_13740 [Neopusillimonas aromaticivorans]